MDTVDRHLLESITDAELRDLRSTLDQRHQLPSRALGGNTVDSPGNPRPSRSGWSRGESPGHATVEADAVVMVSGFAASYTLTSVEPRGNASGEPLWTASCTRALNRLSPGPGARGDAISLRPRLLGGVTYALLLAIAAFGVPLALNLSAQVSAEVRTQAQLRADWSPPPRASARARRRERDRSACEV